MSARKTPRYEYRSPNIVIVPTLSFCKGASTKDKEPTVQGNKTVNTEEKVEIPQIPPIIRSNNVCESVLNQDLVQNPVMSVPVTSNLHVNYAQNTSQLQNTNFEWDNNIRHNTFTTATNYCSGNTQPATNTFTEHTRDGVLDQRFTCTVYNKVQSMENVPTDSVQHIRTQIRGHHSKATKDIQLPSGSGKNALQTKSLKFLVGINEKEIKFPKGITKQPELENKTKSINENNTKITLSEITNNGTKQSKTPRTKPKSIILLSPTKVHHINYKKHTQQNSQSDHHSKHMKSTKNETHDSIRKTIDKHEKFKRMQSKSTSTDQIKKLSLELNKVQNEIQKRKRDLMIKEMLIQKEQQAINRAKQQEQTNTVKDNTLNNSAELNSSKSIIAKNCINELTKKFSLRKEINKTGPTDELISKIQNVKNKYDKLKSKASKEMITSNHPEKKSLCIKSVVNVPHTFSLHDKARLQNQYEYNKEKYTMLQNNLSKPLTRTIQQSKKESQDQEANLTTKCNIKYRKNAFEGNHDNLHITLNNEKKETEEQFSNRKVKLQKKKRKNDKQIHPVYSKRLKKVEFIINVVTEDSKQSTEGEENSFSFLDDINVDEIAEYLNGSHDIKEHVTETENKKTLDQSVSLKESLQNITFKHDTHELQTQSLFAQLESETTYSLDKFKDLSTPTENNFVTDNINAVALGSRNRNDKEMFEQKLLNVELLMEQIFHDNAEQLSVSRSLTQSDEKITIREKNYDMFEEIDLPSKELNNNECDKNIQGRKLGLHGNKKNETTCLTSTFNRTTKKIETFVSHQVFNDTGETENVHEKDHKTILSDDELISEIANDKKESHYITITEHDEKYKEFQMQLFAKINKEEMHEPSLHHNVISETQTDLTQNNKKHSQRNEIASKVMEEISQTILKDSENKTDMSDDVTKVYEVIVTNNEGECFLNNDSSQPLIQTMYLNDNDFNNTSYREKNYENKNYASIKNNSEIITQTAESDSIKRENLKLTEDVQVNGNIENNSGLLGHIMIKSSDSAHKDRFINDHRQIITQTVPNNTETSIKTVDTIIVTDNNSNDASTTETVVEPDNLFDFTGKTNDNGDVNIVEPILKTKVNANSEVKIVKPVLETVDLTKEDIFTIQVSSDDSSSNIYLDSSKSTVSDDSILDIHIRCQEIGDLNLIDSDGNDNNHSNTSNNLEVSEIKSTTSINYVKEQTSQEHIDDQPNARHEIVLSEQINAECRNNTSPCKENTTLKNEAQVHVKSAVQDIQIAEKNLLTHDKKNSENIAKQSCLTKFKSIDPTGKLALTECDKPLVKKMTERIFEYIDIEYTVVSLIHNGKFSEIFKCKDSTGNEIAAKVSKVDDGTTGYEREQMLMKVQDGIPKEKFSCVYLINGLAVESKWCYLLEYYPKNLQQALNECGKSFHIDTMLHFAQQLVSAVVILRNNNIVHSDIKPSHILIDSNNKRLKLCGFDTAYYIEHMQLTGVVGTINYRAPEAILGYSEGHSVDVWATALVLHEMATNQKLFPGSTNNEVLYQQMCVLGKVPWLMVQRSEFKKTYFRGNCFLRQRPFRAISKFSRSAKVSTSVSEAYHRDWYALRNVAERQKDFARLRQFCNVLNQMLVLDPASRLTIEFVYAHPLIYSQ